MKNKITLLALSCAFSVGMSFGQRSSMTPVKRECSAMDVLEHHMSKDPSIKKRMDRMEAFTQKKVQEFKNTLGRLNGDVYQIPVVVHVLHTNNTNNISNAQIQSQLDVLNADFRRTNSDRDNKWSQAADSKIEFYLAEVDPDGNATTGITRTRVRTSTWITGQEKMKSSATGGVDAWDTDEYLNMWVVDNIRRPDGITVLGYAQFPWDNNASTDGVVMADQFFGTSGTAEAPFDGGRTTTHEVGHFFGLRHIWGDSSDCRVDDFVDDTPKSNESTSGCGEGKRTCGSLDMTENYMDYSDDDCLNLFTAGQRDRMHTYLVAGGSRRTLALSDKRNTNPVADTCSSTVTSFPYSESFESGLGAWTQDTGDSFDWTRDANGTPSSSTGPSKAATGTYYMYTESSDPNYPTKTARFNSPCFDLTSVSSPKFKFKYHMYGSAMGTLKLEVKEDGETAWKSVWTKSGNQGNSWEDAEVTLAAKKQKLRFSLTTASSYTSDAAIDAISLGEDVDTTAPTAPTNLSASDITKTTLSLSWTASTDNVGVTGYQVFQGSTNIGTVTSAGAEISDLEPGTTHTFSIKAIDARGNVSAASNSVTITTLSNTYCSYTGTTQYEWIDYVSFGGMTNRTGASAGYSDYTTRTATVSRGTTTSIVVSAGFTDEIYKEYWSVWIDFNQNGEFEESERVVRGHATTTGNVRADVEVPSTALLGETRMRVAMKDRSQHTSACGSYNYGEVEDYTVNITAGGNTRVITQSSDAQELSKGDSLDFVAFPNPASDFVQVKFASKVNGATYQVVNTIGRTVMSGDLKDGNINVSKLTSGMYIINVNDGQKTLTTKILKK